MCSASSANSTRRCGWIAQPTTRRENRSSTTARYSQPSHVQTYVMSVLQRSLGCAASKARARTLGATGRWWSLSVVHAVPLEGQADQPHVLQQSGDPRPANWDPVLPELLVDPRAAVRSAAGGMDRPDAYLQPVVVPLLRARGPDAPRRSNRWASPVARCTSAARRGGPSPREQTRTSCVFFREEGRRFF